MTTNGTHAAILIVVLTAGLVGCEGGRALSPAAPSPVPQQAPQPPGGGPDTYQVADVILSGVVYEMTSKGRVPIEGVRVRSDYFHVLPTPDAVTDAQGVFSVGPLWVCPCSWAPWVDAGITAIWVDRDGYEAPAGQPASIFGRRLDPRARPDLRLRDVLINGDTQFDIELVRR